jgi:hypothetical protein
MEIGAARGGQTVLANRPFAEQPQPSTNSTKRVETTTSLMPTGWVIMTPMMCFLTQTSAEV